MLQIGLSLLILMGLEDVFSYATYSYQKEPFDFGRLRASSRDFQQRTDHYRPLYIEYREDKEKDYFGYHLLNFIVKVADKHYGVNPMVFGQKQPSRRFKKTLYHGTVPFGVRGRKLE